MDSEKVMKGNYVHTHTVENSHISHIYFDPPGISIVILWNSSVCVCVFRSICMLVAHHCVRASMQGGVNAKPFDTSAAVALMYVTAAVCFPFSQLCEPPPPASL